MSGGPTISANASFVRVAIDDGCDDATSTITVRLATSAARRVMTLIDRDGMIRVRFGKPPSRAAK